MKRMVCRLRMHKLSRSLCVPRELRKMKWLYHLMYVISLACTKTRNNRNETTGTKPPEPPEPPERPEQESEMTGTTETKIEHDRNKEFEFICKKPELQN